MRGGCFLVVGDGIGNKGSQSGYEIISPASTESKASPCFCNVQ